MSLTQSLERLVDIFEHRGIPMRQHLRPGLKRADLQAALSPLGLVPPEELYELYEWHDGVDDPYKPEKLFGEHQFIPLSDAIQWYKDLLKYYDQQYFSISLAQCFPFAFYEGDYCTIYCEPTLTEGLLHPVIGIYHSIGVLFETIDQMVQTAAEWYVSGIYDTSPVNDALKASIRKRLNPRISYDL